MMKKRVLAMLLCVVMLIGLLPANAEDSVIDGKSEGDTAEEAIEIEKEATVSDSGNTSAVEEFDLNAVGDVPALRSGESTVFYFVFLNDGTPVNSNDATCNAMMNNTSLEIFPGMSLPVGFYCGTYYSGDGYDGYVDLQNTTQCILSFKQLDENTKMTLAAYLNLQGEIATTFVNLPIYSATMPADAALMLFPTTYASMSYFSVKNAFSLIPGASGFNNPTGQTGYVSATNYTFSFDNDEYGAETMIYSMDSGIQFLSVDFSTVPTRGVIGDGVYWTAETDNGNGGYIVDIGYSSDYADNDPSTDPGEIWSLDTIKQKKENGETGVTWIGLYEKNAYAAWAPSRVAVTTVNILSDTIINIGDELFDEFSNLTSVVFATNGGLKTIGEKAFRRCEKLTSITLPADLEKIGDYSFVYCENLESVSIPNTVTEIGDYAFCSSGLKSVTIPSSVETIGNSAFYQCKKLVSVTLSEGLETLDEYAFSGTSLTSVTIPKSLKKIGERAFSYCRSLASVTLQEGLETIGNEAFKMCKSLNGITIPASVTTIGMSAFEMYFDGVGVKDNEFTNLTFAADSNLISIGNNAFEYCYGIKSVIIPKSVKTIGEYAFRGVYCLESVSFEKGSALESWGIYAFSHCYMLTSFEFPDSKKFTCINSFSFNYCKKLKSISIPETITEIQSYAFSSCSSLENITIPENVEIITMQVFARCSSLKSIKIPKKVTTIQNRAFYECTALADVSFADDCVVSEIGEAAFNGCSSLTSVTIPKSVTKVASTVFANCISLESVIFHSGLTTINGTYQFSGCTSLKKVALAGGNWKTTELDDIMTRTETAVTGAGNAPTYYILPEATVTCGLPTGLNLVQLYNSTQTDHSSDANFVKICGVVYKIMPTIVVGDNNYDTLADAVTNIGSNTQISISDDVKLGDAGVTIPTGVTMSVASGANIDLNGQILVVDGSAAILGKVYNGTVRVKDGATFSTTSSDVLPIAVAGAPSDYQDYALVSYSIAGTGHFCKESSTSNRCGFYYGVTMKQSDWASMSNAGHMVEFRLNYSTDDGKNWSQIVFTQDSLSAAVKDLSGDTTKTLYFTIWFSGNIVKEGSQKDGAEKAFDIKLKSEVAVKDGDKVIYSYIDTTAYSRTYYKVV